MKDVRSFIAIELPQAVKDELVDAAALLAARTSGYRWVKPEALHLTLRFLGYLDPRRFDEVSALVNAGIKAEGPIRLKPLSVGGFPTAKRARVVWVGLDGDLARLHALSDALDKALAGIGIASEERPFKAHLTIGRVDKDGRASGLPLDGELDAWAGSGWTSTEVVLYESRLSQAGALHLERARGKVF